MDSVKVRIIGQAITARYGTLNTGDILKTDAAFAKHLVEDCSAAEYCTPQIFNDEEEAALLSQEDELQRQRDMEEKARLDLEIAAETSPVAEVSEQEQAAEAVPVAVKKAADKKKSNGK